MTDQYNPPEDQIVRVLKKKGGDRRKLAIAYLRSQHRFNKAMEVERMKQSVDGWATAMGAVLN